jgi:hypothetical protein
VPTPVAGRPVCRWRRRNPRRESQARGSPTLLSIPPRRWDPRGVRPALQQSPAPRSQTLSPAQPLGGAGVAARPRSRSLRGPRAPARRLPHPLPRREEETRRPSLGPPGGGPARTVPAPPSRSGSDVRSPSAPARGERGGGAGSHHGQRLAQAANVLREGRGLKVGGVLEARGGAGASAAAPKLGAELSRPLPGLPQLPGRGPPLGRGCWGCGGGGRLRNNAGRGRPGRGGGRGRNVELSRGTQRGHHGECRMDRPNWPITARCLPQARGGCQWGPRTGGGRDRAGRRPRHPPLGGVGQLAGLKQQKRGRLGGDLAWSGTREAEK